MDTKMIRRCLEEETQVIFEIINDAARAYKGVIPADRYNEPYMPMQELEHEINSGVEFWGYEQDGLEDTESRLVGVMGIQDKSDYTLIRHAYVRTEFRQKGIGGRLLKHIETLTDKSVLVGTWKDAGWAIDFYNKHGYKLVSSRDKDYLLKTYWDIPIKQVLTSVVLANKKYFEALACMTPGLV